MRTVDGPLQRVQFTLVWLDLGVEQQFGGFLRDHSDIVLDGLVARAGMKGLLSVGERFLDDFTVARALDAALVTGVMVVEKPD